MSKTYTVSLLIPAHNEEKNIRMLLRHLVGQKTTKKFDLKEIVVVASGCDDKTEEVVKDLIKTNRRIKLLSQKVREGKTSAINLFLKNTNSDIIVMESADTILDAYTINKLLKPFMDKKTGMTTGRPIPISNSRNVMSSINNIIWKIHHKISLNYPPKVGELVAFRNIVKKVPKKTAADEESISAIIQQKNYKIVYVPNAIVRNKGPESISELIKQRKRIFIGHLWIMKNQDYIVPTLKSTILIKETLKEMFKNPKKIRVLMFLILLEMFVRVTAIIDFYIRKKDEHKWGIAKTTKNLGIR